MKLVRIGMKYINMDLVTDVAPIPEEESPTGGFRVFFAAIDVRGPRVMTFTGDDATQLFRWLQANSDDWAPPRH